MRDFHTLENPEIECPYCGETITVEVDTTAGSVQSFVSDCEVCCKPIEFRLRVSEDEDSGDFDLRALRGD